LSTVRRVSIGQGEMIRRLIGRRLTGRLPWSPPQHKLKHKDKD